MNSQPGSELPHAVEKLLSDLVSAAKSSFQEDLRSVVLFGSGAEGRLRTTSDLNLLFVLTKFDQSRADAFREPLRAAYVACRTMVMFVLESELEKAAEAFAVKFDDISRRHRILHGDDLIGRLTTSRQARKQRLNQILLNLSLRLRERYSTLSLREEQLALVIAETAGPLRSASATLLELEGCPAENPRAALRTVAGQLIKDVLVLDSISKARDERALPPGVAVKAMFQLMALADGMRLRTEKLS